MATLVAGLASVVVRLLVPLLASVDLRRRRTDAELPWGHVAAMPLLDLSGLVGHLVRCGIDGAE